jgi:hypothetical protein
MLNRPEGGRFCTRLGIIAIRGDMEVGGSRNGNKCEGTQTCDKYWFHFFLFVVLDSLDRAVEAPIFQEAHGTMILVLLCCVLSPWRRRPE